MKQTNNNRNEWTLISLCICVIRINNNNKKKSCTIPTSLIIFKFVKTTYIQHKTMTPCICARYFHIHTHTYMYVLLWAYVGWFLLLWLFFIPLHFLVYRFFKWETLILLWLFLCCSHIQPQTGLLDVIVKNENNSNISNFNTN